MISRKYQQAAKTAGQWFSIAAVITELVFDVIGAFFRIPQAFAWIKWVGAGVVGLITGALFARNTLAKEEEFERLVITRQKAPRLSQELLTSYAPPKQSTSIVFTELRREYSSNGGYLSEYKPEDLEPTDKYEIGNNEQYKKLLQPVHPGLEDFPSRLSSGKRRSTF